MSSPAPSPAPSPALSPIKPYRRSFASLRAIVALIMREMATTYGRSPGGYLWAVLEPVAGIALLTIAFSIGFRAPALGTSFAMFYATGMLPFVMYNTITGKLAQSLNFSRPLLAYPTVTFLDALIARFVLNLLTQLMVGYLVFFGIMLFFETRATPDLGTIVEAFALTAALALGTGTLNTFLMTRFPVWQQAWSILMRPMFIISGIFFMFDQIPQPYRDWLWWNPLIHVIGLMRRGFYATYDATYVSVSYVLGVSAVTLALGLLFLRRYHRDLLTQ